MRQLIELQYQCQFLSWNEPTGDEDASVQFIALMDGRLIVADSLALVLSALQDACHLPLKLAA